jgi:hypothetical protein
LTREDIADRLINYADAAAAFSLVNSIAFVVTLAQSDVRSSIAIFRWGAIFGQLFTSLVVMATVVVLRKTEIKFRASDSSVPQDVEEALRWFFVVRLVIIGVSTLFTIGVLFRLRPSPN